MKGVSGVKSLGGEPKLSERYSVTTCRAASNSGACRTPADSSAWAGSAAGEPQCQLATADCYHRVRRGCYKLLFMIALKMPPTACYDSRASHKGKSEGPHSACSSHAGPLFKAVAKTC